MNHMAAVTPDGVQEEGCRLVRVAVDGADTVCTSGVAERSGGDWHCNAADVL